MSSSSHANPPPPSAIHDQNLSDPLPSFHRQPLNLAHVPASPPPPINNACDSSYPPPNVFHNPSTPQVSMPPPTHHSNLPKFPISSLPSHRHHSNPLSFQHSSPLPYDYSLPQGPITSAPPLPPHHVRLLKPPQYSQSLISRIAHLENRVRNSPYLHEILTEMSNRTSNVATSVDIDNRIRFSAKLPDDDILSTHAFPKTDVDADYCLEDTPGLATANFNLLKETLYSHLSRVRRHAQESVRDLEACLAPQVAFRAIPAAEMDRRIQFVVKKFIEARQQILHKFRGYVRNRRWIENVATRQRRGCLTHRQNNILRLWLFTHFDNPYPDNADKRKLIAETTLNVTQINNWLINARSRVWKPTVEIMSGEKIRKDMKKRLEARANGQPRDWELGEFSIVPTDKNLSKRDTNSEPEYRTRSSIPSLPINTAPGAQMAAQNTSLGIPPLSGGMHNSAGGIIDGGSSIPHEGVQHSTQPAESLADVSGGWLVPQSFGNLEFNHDGNNQHHE